MSLVNQQISRQKRSHAQRSDNTKTTITPPISPYLVISNPVANEAGRVHARLQGTENAFLRLITNQKQGTFPTALHIQMKELFPPGTEYLSTGSKEKLQLLWRQMLEDSCKKVLAEMITEVSIAKEE